MKTFSASKSCLCSIHISGKNKSKLGEFKETHCSTILYLGMQMGSCPSSFCARYDLKDASAAAAAAAAPTTTNRDYYVLITNLSLQPTRS